MMREKDSIPTLSEEELAAMKDEASAYLHRVLQHSLRDNLQARRHSLAVLEAFMKRFSGDGVCPTLDAKTVDRVASTQEAREA